MSETETGGLGAGRIEPRELEQEMRSSFLDYAMSRDRRARAPGRPRRAEARSPPRALLDVDERQPAGSAVREVRPHRRRRDGQVPPPRRPGDLRHARAAGAAVLACATRSSTARETSARSTTTRRPRSATPRLGSSGWRRSCFRDRLGHGRLRAQLRRVAAGAARPARTLPEPARERVVGDRRRHGDEHAASPPRRDGRRSRRADRQPRRRTWTR